MGNLNAQEVDKIEPVKNEWTFLVEPYLLFPMMKGNVGIGILPDATLEASASDIFSNLKMGFMLNAEAWHLVPGPLVQIFFICVWARMWNSRF